MTTMNRFALALTLTISTSLGCVTDEAVAIDDAEELSDVEQQSFCFVPPTPPAHEWYYGLGTPDDETLTLDYNYGTSACSRADGSFGNVRGVSVSLPSAWISHNDCKNSELTATIWSRTGSTWTRRVATTKAGQPTNEFGCQLAIGYDYVDSTNHFAATDEIFISASLSRTTCTSSGLCGTARGLPVRVSGSNRPMIEL